MNKIKLVFIAALVAAPTSVYAQIIQQTRCAIDSLSVQQAIDRLAWARKCGLTRNTGAVPLTGNPANFFQSTKAADDVTFVGANEYRENTTAQAFTNNVNNFEVNYSFAWSLFGTFFSYHVFQDASGPTLNFFDWSKPGQQRAQPLYPSFDNTPSGGGTQLPPSQREHQFTLYPLLGSKPDRPVAGRELLLRGLLLHVELLHARPDRAVRQR